MKNLRTLSQFSRSKKAKKFYGLFVLIIIIAGFQNCSQTRFNSSLLGLNTNGSTSTGLGGASSTPTPLAVTITRAYQGAISQIRSTPQGYFILGSMVSDPNARRDMVLIKQDGSIDPSFQLDNALLDGGCQPVAIDSLGLMLCNAFVSATKYNLVRLASNGSIDPTYTTHSNTGQLSAVLQKDGKVLFYQKASYGPTASGPLFRLNADGSTDSSFTFTLPTGFYSPSSVALQSDSKILLMNGNRLLRYNTDGSADTTFNFTAFSPGGFSGTPTVVVNALGEIYYISDGAEMRVHADGSVDTTYSPSATALNTANYAVQGAVAEPDGKLIYAIQGAGFVRLNEDGTLDSTYLPNKQDTSAGEPPPLTFLPNGQSIATLIVPGTNTTTVYKPQKLNANGSVDTSFQPPNVNFFNSPYEFIGGQAFLLPNGELILSNDNIYIGGGKDSVYYKATSNANSNSVLRFNSGGAVDSSFKASIDPSSGVYSIFAQPDGKIILRGNITSYAGTPVSVPLIRLNTDGTLDSTFNPSVQYLILGVQSDDKLLVSSNYSKAMQRTLANGTLDTSFVADPLLTSFPAAAVEDSTGRILVIRSIANCYNSANASSVCALDALVRLNSDGSTDTTFKVDKSLAALVNPNSLVIQPDGKYLVGGSIGQAGHGIARFNNDGSLDATFNSKVPLPTQGSAFVSQVLLQTDGKIVYFSTATNTIGRLNSDGSVDSNYLAPVLLAGSVSAITLDSNNRLIVAGSFVMYQGQRVEGLIRFNSDGSFDNQF